MATEAQASYISDLAVIKTKEFKEVKEMLVASGIVKSESKTVSEAQTIATITDVLTDSQASRFIDVLIATKTPVRSNTYSTGRINKTIDILDDIMVTIDNWDFPE